jgi:hypothetical protein
MTQKQPLVRHGKSGVPPFQGTSSIGGHGPRLAMAGERAKRLAGAITDTLSSAYLGAPRAAVRAGHPCAN